MFPPSFDSGLSPNPAADLYNPGPGPGPKQDGSPSLSPDLNLGNLNLTPAEKALVDAINATRAQEGKKPVAPDSRLMCAARMHVLDVGPAKTCGHVGTDGSWPWDRAEKCGFPQGNDWTVNEVAASGQTTGAEAVACWVSLPSVGHREAVLHDQATLVGVAIYEDASPTGGMMNSNCFIAVFDCCVAGM